MKVWDVKIKTDVSCTNWISMINCTKIYKFEEVDIDDSYELVVLENRGLYTKDDGFFIRKDFYNRDRPSLNPLIDDLKKMIRDKKLDSILK